MLDIQIIRDNPDLVEEKSRQKGYPLDLKKLLALDTERRTRITQLEELRSRRNKLSDQTKAAKPNEADLIAAKSLKEEIQTLEKQLAPLEADFEQLLSEVPNLPLDGVPVGQSEANNQVTKKIGEPVIYGFVPKSHEALGVAKDLLDKERATRISGSRFAYLKGDLVLIQFALVQFVFQTMADEKLIEKLIREHNLELVAKPFVAVLPPALIRTEAYKASTRLNAEEVTYKLADDELWLNASAEHSLCNMYLDEVIDETLLPLRYIGYSTSFRREAGTYGKDTEGIIRMHQFDKMEMEVFSTPESGYHEHLLMVALQEHLVRALGLPYQVLQKCTADIGKPNAQGVDIEVWFPSQQTYRETHTADYMTDYQARSLKTRLKRSGNGSIDFVHTNDATAFAMGRILAAIMENYQTADGRIMVPDVLRPLMRGKSEI